MFKLIPVDDLTDLDELYEDLSDDIIKLAQTTASVVTRSGPVLTGLFRGNWSASIDIEYDGSFIHEDPTGSETLSKLNADISGFNLLNDKVIYIQNNVKNLDTGEAYAQSVGWDNSGRKAESLMNSALIIGAESLE